MIRTSFPPQMDWGQSMQRGMESGSPAYGQLFAQPANFANVLGGNFGNMAQGMAGLGNSYSNAYGAYGAGLGSIANARANEASARYGANAMAEAARQAGVGNIGSAALGAYGSAANSALAAWAANQQAYNRSAADMHSANQQGLSQYGQSRNAALGNLGNAYGSLGKAQTAANAMSNINLSGNFGGVGGGGSGGGFAATGPGGPIASGTYGGAGGGGVGGGGFSLTGSSNRSSSSMGAPEAYGGLTSLQQNLMAGDVLRGLNYNADAGREQLDRQHYTSRGMPSQMLDQTLGGLLRLGGDAYKGSSRGMDQFYANTQMDERPYQSALDRLTGGYRDVSRNLGGLRGDMRSAYNASNEAVRRLYDDSIGSLLSFRDASSPVQRVYDQTLRDVVDARRRGQQPAPHLVQLLEDLQKQRAMGGGIGYVTGRGARA